MCAVVEWKYYNTKYNDQKIFYKFKLKLEKVYKQLIIAEIMRKIC